jgi:hypothetical protein
MYSTLDDSPGETVTIDMPLPGGKTATRVSRFVLLFTVMVGAQADNSPTRKIAEMRRMRRFLFMFLALAIVRINGTMRKI